MKKLEKIKSKTNIRDIKVYMKRKIFLFLEEKQKLNIILYNKELQKELLVDIEDYKRSSGKYKIGEKDGIGKEYILNTNILIFEGEYLNGKRHGKGKEYNYKGKLEFN